MCFLMALSSKIKGVSHKKVSAGLQLHQERFSEKDGVEALKNTDSHIDVSQTKYNKLLFKSDELEGRSVKKFVIDEFAKVNEKRKAMGKRGFRADSNTIGMGNFQISDDTLKLIGYDKSKKWDEQSETARNNVVAVYSRMVANAVSKPDVYGKILTATLHVDESTPHVDFLTTGVDAERPDWSLREVLNGKEWRDENGKRRFPKKGEKLRAMQDDLNTIFSDDEKKNFNLTRGLSKSERFDFARKTRKAEKHIKKESERLNKRKDSLDVRESSLDAREKSLNVREAQLAQGLSESLSEAQRELERVKQEKDRLEQEKERIAQENARERAELARLDGISLDQRDKKVLEYMKNTMSKNVSGKTLYQVVDGNRQKADDERLMNMLNNTGYGTNPTKSPDFGLSKY